MTNEIGESFERELRSICERAYHRPSRADNPVAKLIRGQLDADATRAFFVGQLESVLAANQIGFPRLLERCVAVDARVQLWGVVFAEYGRGHVDRSDPALFQKLLIALGATKESCETKRLDGGKEVESFAKMSWPELLAWAVARTSIAPRVFPAIERSLSALGPQAAYFKSHRARDAKALPILLGLVARQPPETHQIIRDSVKAFFESQRDFCCDLGAVAFPPAFTQLNA